MAEPLVPQGLTFCAIASYWRPRFLGTEAKDASRKLENQDHHR
ncbi:hypothetical protein D9615_006636 [Tricholomella constricta]|uniref:Uncharacterized protein n=1 Tax=Tricholomella constricta TaxID=117010 RepID=A0A8H5H9Y9_9AGAR|nr:hypothetical protein D9615_006636 [Tricholomella constricta]